MKLVTYSLDGGESRVGSLEGEEIKPLAHEDMIEFIEYGGGPAPRGGTVSLGEARPPSPITTAPKGIRTGIKYQGPAAKTGARISGKPILFPTDANPGI